MWDGVATGRRAVQAGITLGEPHGPHTSTHGRHHKSPTFPRLPHRHQPPLPESTQAQTNSLELTFWFAAANALTRESKRTEEFLRPLFFLFFYY